MNSIVTTLQKNFTPILIIVGLVIFSSNLKSLFQTFNSDDEELDNDDLFPQSSATITDVEAKTIAETLYTALVTYLGGTNEDLVYAQLAKLNNQDDFNKVYNKFGLRQYSKFWGNEGDPLTSSKHDLIKIMSNEFNQEEQDYIRQTFPQIKVF
ncbi:hypothetical protein [uncultured Winogradskyella sp.]|uniref:hypothetical protein n=1 Tax=uncultured Winogradskyella sp. TaxID=395353 RepID=UPI002611EC46|nr:hypothetical protein [uncultured Winogradskyella sp.]